MVPEELSFGVDCAIASRGDLGLINCQISSPSNSIPPVNSSIVTALGTPLSETGGGSGLSSS